MEPASSSTRTICPSMTRTSVSETTTDVKYRILKKGFKLTIYRNSYIKLLYSFREMLMIHSVSHVFDANLKTIIFITIIHVARS